MLPPTQERVSIEPTPIHRLPDDALYIIFLHASIHDDPHDNPTVAQVCRPWRSVAINAQALWAHVRFDFRRTTPFHHQNLCILRSGSSPLHISIVNYSRCALVQESMGMLLPHLSRWKSFTTSGFDEGGFCDVLDKLSHASAPILEVLNVVNRVEDHRWVFQPFGGGAPRLRELEIGCGRFSIHAPLFSHLSKLSIRTNYSFQSDISISVHDILVVVGHAAATLEELRVDECTSIGPALPSPPIILTKLRRLNLGDRVGGCTAWGPYHMGAWWARVLITGIRGPAFQEFGEYIHPGFLQAFSINPPFPFYNLRTLRISMYSFERPDPPIPLTTYISVLSQLSELVELRLSGIAEFDMSILATLVPSLHILAWYRGECPPTTLSSLKDMVQTRQLSEDLTNISDLHLNGAILSPMDILWLGENVERFECGLVSRSVGEAGSASA